MRLLKVYRPGWRRSKDAARKTTTDLNLDGKGMAYGRRSGEGSWNRETEPGMWGGPISPDEEHALGHHEQGACYLSQS